MKQLKRVKWNYLIDSAPWGENVIVAYLQSLWRRAQNGIESFRYWK